MVRRFSPYFLATLALSVANPLLAAPPAPSPSDMGPNLQYIPAQSVPTVASKSAAASVPAAKVPVRPVGVWVRDIGPVKVVLKITDDRLTATAIFLFTTGEEECPVVRATIDADYAVAKDGTLFGVIFGADATHPMYAAMFQPLDGHPLAFGWRVDGDTLTVRNLKWLGFGLYAEKPTEFDELPVLSNGRYTRMDEAKLPEWEKKLPGTATPLMRTVVGGLTAPPSNAPSAPPLFRHVEGKCEAPTPVAGMPTASQPLPATSPIPPNAANPLHGTWLREQDGMQVVLKLTEKRLNVEIIGAFPIPGENGPPIRFTQSLDADYSTTPDGTVFGILTGIDVSLGQGLPPEAYESIKEARREFQKVIGAMFKFSTRLDGDKMTLSHARASLFETVRGPDGEEKADTSGVMGELLSGRFERVTGKLPLPKPIAEGIINQYSADPNGRIEQLPKLEGEQRKVSEEMRKFWNNDMPNQIPMPKCKDCVPPLKLTPGESKPVPPILKSRG